MTWVTAAIVYAVVGLAVARTVMPKADLGYIDLDDPADVVLILGAALIVAVAWPGFVAVRVTQPALRAAARWLTGR